MSDALALPPGFPHEVEAFACDLDRTLIAPDALLRPRTAAAIRAASAAGIHVVIVTGRMLQATRPYCTAAGLDGPVVCYQGAVVADPVSGEFLRHETIPLELAREAIREIQGHGYSPYVYVGDQMHVAAMTEHSERYGRFQHVQVNVVGDLLAWLDRPPTKLVVVGEPTALDALEPVLQASLGARMFVAKSLPHFLELANKGVTKGSGIAVVADLLGFSLERTVGFGDGENDVELLEAAGFAVAVGDAHPRLLSVADWHCPGPEEEGVAQVFEAVLTRRLAR